VPPEDAEDHVGRRLYGAGLKQGAVLRPSDLKFVYSALAPNGGGIETKERSVKPKERLVVASQDCDILARPEQEPYVELLICKKEKPERCARLVEGNSSRWFLLDKDECFVAQAFQRVHIRKEALERLEPEGWSLDGEALERFARWLARRYIRPAFPDEFVEAYQDPVDAVFEGAPAEVVGRFSSVVNEIRISKSSVQGPPYDLEFLLLTTREDLSEQEAEAVALVQDGMEAALTASPLVASVGFSFRTLYETSIAEYFASDPIYLEHLTYEGEEQPSGAEPPPQA
jgi:hypothetical protein